MDQLALIEPTGPEVARLAFFHLQAADKQRTRAALARSRGWASIEAAHLSAAARHDDEAECLAMLADFERLARIA